MFQPWFLWTRKFTDLLQSKWAAQIFTSKHFCGMLTSNNVRTILERYTTLTGFHDSVENQPRSLFFAWHIFCNSHQTAFLSCHWDFVVGRPVEVDKRSLFVRYSVETVIGTVSSQIHCVLQSAPGTSELLWYHGTDISLWEWDFLDADQVRHNDFVRAIVSGFIAFNLMSKLRFTIFHRLL